MAVRYTEPDRCALAAKYLRELADRIEARQLIPIDIDAEREVVRYQNEYDAIVTVPTPYRLLTIRLQDGDRDAVNGDGSRWSDADG